MNKKVVKLLMMMTLIVPLVSGCSDPSKGPNGVSFVIEQEKTGPRFLDGSVHEMTLTDTLVVAEVCDLSLSDDYSIVITSTDGYTKDISHRSIWNPEVPGQYTITYTINSGKDKGTATFDLKVKVPDISWQYTLENKPYNVGDVLNFDKYFEGMNISVNSYYKWKMVMDSVEVDGEVTDLKGKSEFQFEKLSKHLFKFHVETEDGQTAEARELISMKYVNKEYLENLKSRNIDLYGELYVDEGNLTLKTGQFFNGNSTYLSAAARPHDMPYIAYKGNYGLNSFLKVDFTGNNMPLMSFFRDDDYSNSLFDETKGVLISGGFLDNSGNPTGTIMNSRISQYGPYLIYKYYDRDYLGDSSEGSVSSPYPGTTNYFSSHSQDTHYRVLVGFTGYDENQYRLTYEMIILDIDNHLTLGRYTASSYNIKLIGSNVRGFDPNPYEDIKTSFFNGNIVLYGNYGKETKLDNVYDIITGKTFDQALKEDCGYTSSNFKDTAPKTLQKNVDYDVSLFGDMSNPKAYFSYESESTKEVTKVTTDKFSISNPGTYILHYADGENYEGTMKIYVSEKSKVVDTENKITYYGTNKDGDSLTLTSGYIGLGANYVGPNKNQMIDQAYVGYDGDYKLGTFIETDFTGKNFPEVSFFSNKYNNSMYYDDGSKEGICVTTGVTDYAGKIANVLSNGTQINYDSPNFVKGINDSWFASDNINTSLLARANLVDGVNYKVLMGFVASGASAIALQWKLINSDTKEVLETGNKPTWNFYTGTNKTVNYKKQSDLKGSIVLYGKFGCETVVNKCAIHENTTLEELYQKVK